MGALYPGRFLLQLSGVGGDRGGGQRPSGGETRPQPPQPGGNWEQEELCRTPNNGAGTLGVRPRGMGVEAQPGLGTVRVSGSRPLHCGTPAGGGDGRGLGPHIQAPQWSSVCWQGPGGGTASGPSSSLPPTFPYFPPSWPDAWVPGGGRLRAPGSASPPGDGDSCPLVPLGTPSSIGIGIGFYGNSETSDGVSQLSSALLHANHTLSAIDHLVLETVERLGEAVRTELTTLEEVLEPRTELVAAARGARRQAEAVAQQLQGLAFWQGVPLSPLQVAEDVSFVEEYRWLAYVLLLLLELLVCLFTLLGLAKQSKWLVIVMTVMSLLVLVLSWGSMGLEAATAVGLSDFCSNPDPYVLNLTQEETGLSSDILSYYFLCNQAVSNPFQQRLTLSQRALANIHSQLLGLEREAVPQFPSAQKPLLSLEETLNVTEGNFHQLVALLHCRGLHKDYGAALRGLCEDALEGLLFLLLFSLLSAGALATALCSLPRAWALFPPSDDYDDTDDDDPFNPQESKRFVQWQSSI
ncbi:protein tweety homolog 1 isoform X4 [Papio anubis]|uniref:protein tweety homolog 1 isoform X4 n=2 Tax=Cercopithecinae TaxID=9528 RepID=UPI0012AE08D9|nr:protein tweety homolog 1 isoform X4 [Papio anubis]